MIRLDVMTDSEYEAFMELSVKDHIDGQIKEGNWSADEAESIMAQQRKQLLPDEQATPNHTFFAVRDSDTEEMVGGLWYFTGEQEGQRLLFVVDIQIYEQYRRRGYGTQVFECMEDQAREMGIQTIALRVFEHNHPARALYEKLGFKGTETALSKTIEPA